MSNWKDALARYDALVAMCPRFARKGKSMPYTSANGHMFSLLNKKGELEQWGTTLFKSYGSTMQGYVLIPEAMFDDMDQLTAYLNESYDYVMTLDPK